MHCCLCEALILGVLQPAEPKCGVAQLFFEYFFKNIKIFFVWYRTIWGGRVGARYLDWHVANTTNLMHHVDFGHLDFS